MNDRQCRQNNKTNYTRQKAHVNKTNYTRQKAHVNTCNKADIFANLLSCETLTAPYLDVVNISRSNVNLFVQEETSKANKF